MHIHVKHMKDPLGVSPTKGNQGTTEKVGDIIPDFLCPTS